MKICKVCGQELSDKDKFCPECGKPVEYEEASASPVESAYEETNDKETHDEKSYNEETHNVEAHDEKSYNEETHNVEAHDEKTYDKEAYDEKPHYEKPYDERTYEKEMKYTVIDDDKNGPGTSQATSALVLGIISVVFWVLGFSAIVSIICGIIGLASSSKALKLGCNNSRRKAGFILSLIGLIVGAIIFILVVLGISLFMFII